jgi:GcrA cell cycle regulator
MHGNRLAAWTDERVQELTALWGSGVDVISIATQLNCTRNAVIGKAHRLGLPQHVKYKRTDHSQSRPQPRRHKPRSKPSAVSGAEQRIVAIMELTGSMCRFPIDDHYCGAPTDGKRSYCDAHHRLAYIAKSPRDMSHTVFKLAKVLEEIA